MKKKLLVVLISLVFLITTLPAVITIPFRIDSSNNEVESSFWFYGNKITIIRDNYGVPHIYAGTKEGLAYGCGYAMAQDRLWQADLYRKQGYGNLAEFGLASIDADYQIRSMAYSKEELREIFDNWVPHRASSKLKEMMLAYVDGINLYISEALTNLASGDPSMIPVEYLAYGLPLEPFTIEDCVAIVVMMAWRFGGCGGDELSYAAALEALQDKYGNELGWAMFNDHFPQNDPGAEVTIPLEYDSWPEFSSSYSMDVVCGSDLPSLGTVSKEYEEMKMGQTHLFESLGLPTKFGSNAFLVSPSKATNGNPLLQGGPQMGQSIPQIVLEVGLHGAGIDAVGMMMPHAPTILIGVSKWGAWTSTTGVSDNMDTYIEVLNPDNQYQYWYNGGWVDMEKRTERFYGPLKSYYEDRDVYRTIHGPIFGWDLDNNLCFSMKTPYYKDELAAEEGWSLFQQSTDAWDMYVAAGKVHAAHNFYWIDRDGNIAYFHSGKWPIKPTTGKDGRPIDDRLPLWGTGEEEWVGVTGVKEMPKCYNPSQGFLANWNNKPITNWPFGESDAGWGQGHRVGIIMELLAEDNDITFEDMNRIVRDAGYNHIPGMNVLDFLVDAAKTDPTIPSEVIDYLEAWDHHYNDYIDPMWPAADATYDDPGLTIFDDWYDRIFEEVFEDDLPTYAEVGPIHREYARVWPSTIIHVFDGPASKLPLNYDYLNGEDRDEVICRVLKWSIGNLTDSLGSDMSTWLTPVIQWWPSQIGALPRAPMHYMNRGTYNQIAEMIVWNYYDWRNLYALPHAVNVIPPGQSGFMNYLGQYNHAYDQLALYETWTYKPMRYNYWDVMKVAESVLNLYM